MKDHLFSLFKIATVALLGFVIALTPINSVLAETANSNAINNAKQAAKEVLKDANVKQQFGKSENGEELIDNARIKASEHLNDVAEKANADKNLPGSQKKFLNNLQTKTDN